MALFPAARNSAQALRLGPVSQRAASLPLAQPVRRWLPEQQAECLPARLAAAHQPPQLLPTSSARYDV